MAGLIQGLTKTWQGTSQLCLARIMMVDGSFNYVPAVQSSFSSIAYEIEDATDTTTSSGTLDPTVVIFNTLQTSSIWTVDCVGYNFLANFPGTAFPNGDTTYSIEITFTLTSGVVFYAVYQVETVTLP